MTEAVNIDVTFPRVQTNASEYHDQPRATWREKPGFYVQSWGSVIRNLTKQIFEAGIDPDSVVHVWHENGKLSFEPAPLHVWADPPNRQPEHFKKKEAEDA